ncbi:MAG: CvpA family protein [Clostridia bacterium]|nr:CvpA family protein [Clostridia bacterium]
MNMIDLIAILVIIASVLIGAKRGFVKSVFSFGSLIISLLLALTLYPVVTDCLEGSFVDKFVHESAYALFDAQTANGSTTAEAGANSSLPEGLQAIINKTISNAAEATKEVLAETVASLALKILGVLIVFFLSKILLWIISLIFDLVSKLPIIRTLNKLMGGAIGAFYGVLILYVILALLAFASATQTLQKPIQMVNDSAIVSVMYNQNILLSFLK